MTTTAAPLDRALALARAALGLSSLQLRTTGDGVPAQRADGSGYLLVVPVRLGESVQILSAVADRPFDAATADALVELGPLLAALLPDGAVRSAELALLDAEADNAQIAAELDVVTAALVSARHASPGGDGAAEVALDEAVSAVRRLQRQLRAESLDAGPAAALARLGAVVTGDTSVLAGLRPALAVAVQRVAETLQRLDESGQLGVEITELTVKFRVGHADKVRDASELERWCRRVSALGGELVRLPDGVELQLTRPRHEGRR
jgi:hypothetical protein